MGGRIAFVPREALVFFKDCLGTTILRKCDSRSRRVEQDWTQGRHHRFVLSVFLRGCFAKTCEILTQEKPACIYHRYSDYAILAAARASSSEENYKGLPIHDCPEDTAASGRFIANSMYRFIRPLLFRLDPETAH